MDRTLFSLALAGFLATSLWAQPATVAPPPKPFGATPNAAQVRHAERAFYVFCHFGVNTFTGREWGTGGESETRFNPTAFDAGQITGTIKASGAKGFILTSKHHDGFCLWPTETTGHNISASPYKAGKGDIVREFSDACKANGIEFGIYVSPWDRNHPDYGTPAYPTGAYRQQVKELTTNYGPLFIIWFDGANSGSGVFKGKIGPTDITGSTTRSAATKPGYFRFDELFPIIRAAQPGIIIFGAEGDLDARWIGNEAGHSTETCRSTINPGRIPKGENYKSHLSEGDLHGSHWVIPEADTSIRRGWFFHPNMSTRSPENLMNLYINTVGHAATLNLNVPPDTRGRVHENDADSLRIFGQHLRKTFAENLAAGATFKASNIRGNDAPAYGPERLLDADLWSAWVTDDAVTTPEVEIVLNGEKTFNLIRLREDIRIGLRVEGVAVDAFVDGAWKQLATTESPGSCRLWRVPKTTSSKVRIRVTQAEVCPALSDFGLFLEPEIASWKPSVAEGTTLLPKADWKVISASSETTGCEARNAIDGKPGTFWKTADGLPQDLVIDLGAMKTVSGFTYTPATGALAGVVDQYAVQLSLDGKTWTTAAEGEFGNMLANPVEQSITFAPAKARHVRFIAKHALGKNIAIVAELGVLGK